MSDLVEFLLARIAEDEEAARASTPGAWSWYYEYNPENPELQSDARDENDLPIAVVWASGLHSEGFVNTAIGDRAHIARHQPARVLAECAAKRAIVESFTLAHDDYRVAHTETLEGQRFGLSKAVAHLAAVYRDHPDYRQEWA